MSLLGFFYGVGNQTQAFMHARQAFPLFKCREHEMKVMRIMPCTCEPWPAQPLLVVPSFGLRTSHSILAHLISAIQDAAFKRGFTLTGRAPIQVGDICGLFVSRAQGGHQLSGPPSTTDLQGLGTSQPLWRPLSSPERGDKCPPD